MPHFMNPLNPHSLQYGRLFAAQTHKYQLFYIIFYLKLLRLQKKYSIINLKKNFTKYLKE